METVNNLRIYNKVRSVPKEAQKTINGGRLNGKTDINPMWRIKTLTEIYGPCGLGWKYKIIEKRLEIAPNGEVAAFLDIELFVKENGEWSEAIPGTGGSSFVANEKNGMYVSDECFKMALTDALSVSCKSLGIGADVYWDKDSTKYDGTNLDKSNNLPSANQQGQLSGQQSNNQQPNNKAQPSDLEKQATAIYYRCTNSTDKNGLGWSKEEYNSWLKEHKEVGNISTTFGKKWTQEDISYINQALQEYDYSDLPFR